MNIECAFLGVLGRDAEQRTSKPGRPHLLLKVRVGDGDAAQWVNVRYFDKDAVEIADKFVKGVRVYVEGKLSLNEWTTADGVVKAGLSVMSFHTRLSAIGRNKPKRARENASVADAYVASRSAPAGRLPSADLNDEIPFAPETL